MKNDLTMSMGINLVHLCVTYSPPCRLLPLAIDTSREVTAILLDGDIFQAYKWYVRIVKTGRHYPWRRFP